MSISEEHPSPTAPAAPEHPTQSGRRLWVLVVALVIVVAVAGAILILRPLIYARYMAAPPPVAAAPTPDSQADIAALKDQLAAAQLHMKEMDDWLTQLGERPVTAGKDDSLAKRVGEMEGAIKTLQARPMVPATLAEEVKAVGEQVSDLKKTSADAGAVLRLADRVEKVEAGLRELQSQRSTAAAQLLAVGQLRAAVDQALPFDSELRAARLLTPQDVDSEKAFGLLKPRSASGIPTRQTLATRFAALEADMVRAEALPAEDSWTRQTLNRLMRLVTVRREDGTAEGSSAAAVAARIKTRLATNDLGAAVTEAESLTGPPAEVAAPWLDDARARLAADQALSELTAQVVAAIGSRQ